MSQNRLKEKVHAMRSVVCVVDYTRVDRRRTLFVHLELGIDGIT